MLFIFFAQLTNAINMTHTHRAGETIALLPVMKARKRGKLAPGENVVPWAQSFLGGTARAAYIFNCANNFDFALNLGSYIALLTATYTGLIAVAIATGAQRDRLVMYMWIGVFIAITIQWVDSNELAGSVYVFTSVTTKFSFLAGIPHAIRTRDGRYICHPFLFCLHDYNVYMLK
jgi:hypothetical protein